VTPQEMATLRELVDSKVRRADLQSRHVVCFDLALAKDIRDALTDYASAIDAVIHPGRKARK
jgi:hypothetical protein